MYPGRSASVRVCLGVSISGEGSASGGLHPWGSAFRGSASGGGLHPGGSASRGGAAGGRGVCIQGFCIQGSA